MALSKEERIDIVLHAAIGSYRAIADDFNRRHPERQPITHGAVGKLIAKFKETGRVDDRERSGRPRSVTDEDSSVAILAAVSKSPHKSTRRLSQEHGLSQRSVLRILHAFKWHPYKVQMLQHLSEDDPDRRIEFCEWALQRLEESPTFSSNILFTDEANFYINGEINHQNWRYWSDSNPNWTDPSKMQGAGKVMVWCGIWGTRIIGPFFVKGNMNSDVYLRMLQEEIVPSLLNEDGEFPEFFQQDGAPPHFGVSVRAWLDQQFPNRWIGRGGPIEWPARSPDLSPLDFYLWGHLKSLVYAKKIRNLDHLQERIVDACGRISSDVLNSVHIDWENRLKLCVQQNGSHIEHIM